MRICLRVAYYDRISPFEELLEKEATTEMFRVSKGIYPKIMTGVFPLKQLLNYNIRHQPDFSTRLVTVVYYSTESLVYLRIKIWELVPTQMINAEFLEAFKSGKKVGAKECPCRLYKTHIHQTSLI